MSKFTIMNSQVSLGILATLGIFSLSVFTYFLVGQVDIYPTDNICIVSDIDNDGVLSLSCGGNDCNDESSATYPGAKELCDNVDNNCDGVVDEGYDEDGDGVTSCNLDCNDKNPSSYPGNTEICNGVDDNCDGTTDEGCNCGAGATRKCGTTDVGMCSYGIQRCLGSNWSVCEGAITPISEICGNKTDENCDGEVSSCPTPPPGPVCGNSLCERGESNSSCSSDCAPLPSSDPSGSRAPSPRCGNGICDDGESTYSCGVDCGAPPPPPPPPSGPPAPPSNAFLTNISCDRQEAPYCRITVNWTDSSSTETGFRVDRKISSGSFVPVATVSENAVAWNDLSVNSERTYVYRIVSYNENGYSDPSNEAIGTTPPLPDRDGDGSADQQDCKPDDPSVYPGAPEICDDKDNNCDGRTDEGCATPSPTNSATPTPTPENESQEAALYDFEDVGSKIFDKSGNENNLTMRGNARRMYDGLKRGNVLFLDGDGDFAESVESLSAGFPGEPGARDSYTLMLWRKSSAQVYEMHLSR